MTQSEFFPPHEGLRLDDLAAALDLRLMDDTMAGRTVRAVSPVYRAKQGDLCYILSRKNRAEFETCEATAVICDEALGHMVSLPCGEEGADMGFRVGFTVVTGIGVRHGVFLDVDKKLHEGTFSRCAIRRVFEP